MYKGEDQVIQYLTNEKKSTISHLAKMTNMSEDSIRRIVEYLKSLGFVKTSLSETRTYSINSEFSDYINSNFPEISVYKKALAGNSISDLSQNEKSIGIKWAKSKEFVKIDGGKLVPTKDITSKVEQESNLLKYCFEQIKQNGLTAYPEKIKELLERKLITEQIKKDFFVELTDKKYVSNEGFDVSIPSANAPLGKIHPITNMMEKIKSIMVELGFVEMEGDVVESSFWNFDSLFQPQDHPARELADTFYLKGNYELPKDKALISRVKKAHEEGWKYKWSENEASKKVLRTHTTALSARYLSTINNKPQKLFAIGRVYRNEATDYKHLAEFHQVEGIIAYEGARFSDLLGILKEFYKKLGFEKIRFRPSFFPYTEPSLEIEVFFEPRKQWMELGGAGILRPEVSIPLAGVYPVLAWGLSLERPLMLSMGLTDIRSLYRNELDFLEESRLKL